MVIALKMMLPIIYLLVFSKNAWCN